MKATSFLDMVTLLSATIKSDNELDVKLSKLIILYNKPPKDLHQIFSNLHQLDVCPDDYFDEMDNTLHFDSEMFAFYVNGNRFIYKPPRNINEVIVAINSVQSEFRLVFKEKIINEIGFNSTFIDVMSAYGI